MLALIIIGVIVLIIALIMLIPIGADINYENGEAVISAKVCGLLLQLIPKPPTDESKPKKEKKAKKPKKEKKKKETAEGEEKAKKKLNLNFNMDEILALVRSVLKGFGKFGRKLKVDRFLLRFTAAGDDPYNTAMTYGYVNAALSSLAPLCRKRFEVKECEISTDVDFTADKMKIDAGIAVTIRIGAIFNMVFTIAFGALGILIRNKLRLLMEKLKAKKDASPAETQDKNIKENSNTEEEERMASNG